jgi:hypothetical protein
LKKNLLVLLALFLIKTMQSQCLQPVNFQLQKNLAMPFPTIQLNMTAHRDTSASKPYLYISGKGAGLLIYNISSITSPTLVTTIGISSFNGLHVMSSTQSGNYLYLALGDHFNASAQKSGMAIVNISNPASPTVTATYSFTANSGAGQVAVEGNYAYLSAMQNGIIVLNVTNKSNIIQESVFKPSIHFPKINPDASEQLKINVRQIAAKNDILYVCYDAGGVRIVNATNKTTLVETGQYSNPALISCYTLFPNTSVASITIIFTLPLQSFSHFRRIAKLIASMDLIYFYQSSIKIMSLYSVFPKSFPLMIVPDIPRFSEIIKLNSFKFLIEDMCTIF